MTEVDVDLATMDGLAQAELVRSKQVTSTELLEAAIARVERVNPMVNAVITTMHDEARAAAAGPLPDGPFAGVPFLLKDGAGNAYAGVRMTSGSRFLLDYVPTEDSELTRRYKAAGLVACGKTNLPEFGLQPTTEPEATGVTRNPWDPGRSAGGSSGGAAAAVAARMVPIAGASDSGGSIRVPASCCGVFGMKPTRLRIASARRKHGVSIRQAMLGEHAVSISVRDSAALLDATAGGLPGDPYVAPAPARPYLDEVGADPGRLRIVYSREAPTGVPLDPDCIAAVEDAARLCEELGHHVEERTLRLDREQVAAPFTTISSAGLAWDIRNWERLVGKVARPDDFEVGTWGMIERARGSNTSAEDFLDALAAMQVVADQVAAFCAPYDLWLTPTVGTTPPPLGSFTATPDDPTRGLRMSGAFLPFTPLGNITGQPAMSIPLFWNADDIPVGVHFMGPYGDEGMLFRLAAQLEEARPWADRIPTIARG